MYSSQFPSRRPIHQAPSQHHQRLAPPPIDRDLAAELPGWVHNPSFGVRRGRIYFHFETERAPSPNLLGELKKLLRGRHGRKIGLIWQVECVSASIEQRVAKRHPDLQFHAEWYPERNLARIFSHGAAPDHRAVGRLVQKKFKAVCEVLEIPPRELAAPKQRECRRLRTLLPDGFQWNVEFRDGVFLATYSARQPSEGYFIALRRALKRYVSSPIVFEPRFDPSRFKKMALQSCPDGVQISQLNLYQTMPGTAIGFGRMRAEVMPHQLPAFWIWVRAVEQQFSIVLDVRFDEISARIKSQLRHAVNGSGLIDRPSQVRPLIEAFHSVRPPRLRDQHQLNPVKISPRPLIDASFLSIDGSDTIDPEDVVSACWVKHEQVARLTVGYVDASALVFPGTRYWKYATRAGHSLYTRANGSTISVPLLGPDLASGALAALERQPRTFWAVSAEIDMGLAQRGRVLSYTIEPAIATNQARLSFSEVDRILAGDGHTQSKQLRLLRDVALALRGRRFDYTRFPRLPAEYPSEVIVEECMVMANSLFGAFAHAQHLPMIFRVYQPPDVARLTEFVDRVRAIGISQAELDDFRDPRRLNALMTALKQHGPIAKGLYLEMLHAFFGMADYDSVRREHRALGVDGYVRIKSRHLDALYNQTVLRSHFGNAPMPTTAFLEQQVFLCRRKQRARDEDQGRLAALAMAEHRARQVGREYRAELIEPREEGSRIKVRGFPLCLLGGSTNGSVNGDHLPVIYQGFDPTADIHWFGPAD